MAYKECPECRNGYEDGDLCFEDDPGHEVCNGCWRSLSGGGGEFLDIFVFEEVAPDEKVG